MEAVKVSADSAVPPAKRPPQSFLFLAAKVFHIRFIVILTIVLPRDVIAPRPAAKQAENRISKLATNKTQIGTIPNTQRAETVFRTPKFNFRQAFSIYPYRARLNRRKRNLSAFNRMKPSASP